jgi:hypothetical protein
MNHTHTLTQHRDIQNWVTARHGMPAISRVPNNFGEMRARLALKFGKVRRPPSALPDVDVDDGMSPVSWSSWLAELDRQHLALKVSGSDEFEFVERRDAARPGSEPLN